MKAICLSAALFLMSSEAGYLAWPQIQGSYMKQEVTQLLAILRDRQLQKTDPERVVRAIERLGEMKSVEAIDDLAQLITFNPIAEKEKAMGIITESNYSRVLSFETQNVVAHSK